MFKIQSEVLKGVVGSIAKGARKARLGENFIFIRTLEEGMVSIFFNGDNASVERRVKADVQGELDVATTLKEIDTKVAALPNDTEILVQLEGSLIKLKWGKKSAISVDTVPETTPMIEIPELVEQVTWAAGTVHGIARVMTPFTALPNSSISQRNPSIVGPNFVKDPDTGETFVRATDGFRAVTMRAAKIDWFSESVSIEASNLLSVADVLPKDAEISVGINKGYSLVVFASGSTTAVVRALSGKYPQIDNLYRTDAKSKWRFDRLELIELCRRVQILSPQRPILEFRLINGKVNAVIPNTLDQSIGVVIDGIPSEFAINAKYLEMAASLFRTEEINLLVEAANKPITMRIDQSDDIRTVLSPAQLR